MQQYTCITCNDAAAKAEREALDQRDDIPLFIGSAEVHRVALFLESSCKIGRCFFRVNALALLSGIVFAQELIDRYIDKVRVRNVAVAIGKSQLFRLEQDVQVWSRLVAKRFEIIAFDDVQHLQRGNALCIRRKLVDIVAAIAGRDRSDPIRMVLLHILHTQNAATALHVFSDTLGQWAAIEGIAPFPGERAIRMSQVSLEQDVTGAWRLTLR